MRFLLDVHVGLSLARALSAEGHDVVHAGISYPEWTDSALLDLAVREERVLVTEDRDFSDLIFAHGAKAPPAIIYIRCEPTDQQEMIPRVIALLDFEPVLNNMIVLRPASTRYRPFPGKTRHNA